MNNTTDITNITVPNTKPALPPMFYRTQTTIIAQGTSLAILGIITLLSNLASIITFLKTQSLRKRSNYMIINLSVADFLVSIVIFVFCPYFLFAPFNITNEFKGILEVLDSFTGAASLISLTMIAVERFYAVVFPFKHRMLRFKHYIAFCLFPWLLASAMILIAVFLDFPRQGVKLDIYTFSRFSILLFSLVVLIVSYLGIWLKSRHVNPSAQNQNRASRDKKLSVTLFIVTLASMLTWLPIQCFSFSLFFFKSVPLPHFNYFFAMKFLQFCNSGINFFIYILRMREFKAGFLALFCCRPEVSGRSERTSTISLSTTASIRELTTTSSLSLNQFKKQKAYVVNNDVTGEESGMGTSQQEIQQGFKTR